MYNCILYISDTDFERRKALSCRIGFLSFKIPLIFMNFKTYCKTAYFFVQTAHCLCKTHKTMQNIFPSLSQLSLTTSAEETKEKAEPTNKSKLCKQ